MSLSFVFQTQSGYLRPEGVQVRAWFPDPGGQEDQRQEQLVRDLRCQNLETFFRRSSKIIIFKKTKNFLCVSYC